MTRRQWFPYILSYADMYVYGITLFIPIEESIRIIVTLVIEGRNPRRGKAFRVVTRSVPSL